MQEIYVEKLGKIIQSKARLEKELGIKITNQGRNVFVNGTAEKEYVAITVLEAINLDFSIDSALQLKDEKLILQKINIKDLTKRHDLERIRARIIGTGGKTLQTLHNLTNCEISLQDNHVGIIGNAETIEDAVQSLTSIIKGSKQGNVYARIEKQKRRKKLLDIRDEVGG